MFVIHSVWEDFLTIAREELGSRVIETWFKAISLLRWDAHEKTVYLQMPNTFVCNWVEKNYRSIFQVHLGRLLNATDIKVIFVNVTQKSAADEKGLVLSGGVQEPNSHKKVATNTFKPAHVVPYKSSAVMSKMAENCNTINKKYTFDTFVVGPSNSLTYAAARAIAQKPGELYNPLFIYGDSGLGKTHLLHAIGNEIVRDNKNAIVLYQTADRFVSEFIYAIRFDKVHRFQKKYQMVDVLLIDDIQFISDKETTQQAFFHLFNSLYDARKQLVFSSDTFPQNINGIAERLRSRLASGMVTDILQPCIEVRTAILKRKAESNGEILHDDVAHFLASQVNSNIRELEGALIRVMAFSHLTKQEITVQLIRSVLGSTIQSKKESVDLKLIIKTMNRYYPYSLDELRSKNRNKDLAFVRQLAMYVMKKSTDKSLREIGAYLGDRNHATVKHALDKIESIVSKNNKLSSQVDDIIKELC